MSQQRIINVARGLEKAQLVIKNANVVNVLSEEIHKADIAIEDGIIVGIGEDYHGEKEIDINGRRDFRCMFAQKMRNKLKICHMESVFSNISDTMLFIS